MTDRRRIKLVAPLEEGDVRSAQAPEFGLKDDVTRPIAACWQFGFRDVHQFDPTGCRNISREQAVLLSIWE